MLSLDSTATLGSSITPSYGITDQELQSVSTSLKGHIARFHEERAHGDHAWTRDPYAEQSIHAVRALAARHAKRAIETVVWVGIGGSGLGPRIMQEAFETPNTPAFIVIDTLDPSVLRHLLMTLNWKRTLVVIASKSGTTLEPMSLFFILWNKLTEAHGEDAPAYVAAVTDPENGHLRDFCMTHAIAMLPIAPEVGGRFSIFSAIGLLPLALLGRNIDAFCEGACAMDAACQGEQWTENISMQLAGIQYILDTKKEYPLRIIMPYGARLQSIGAWDQQLIAESLGKTETCNPIPVAAIGSADQHSLLQQWMAGPRKFWHLFIRANDHPVLRVPDNIPDAFAYVAGKSTGVLLDACYEGTRQALSRVKRPHATLSLPVLDEYHLGQLFWCLMTEVVLLGKLYRIDPYGQPAVDVGKRITKQILENL